MSSVGKKIRGANWSDEDTKNLIDAVRERSAILFDSNGRLSGQFARDKVWADVAQYVNERSDNLRTVSQMKERYKNVQRITSLSSAGTPKGANNNINPSGTSRIPSIVSRNETTSKAGRRLLFCGIDDSENTFSTSNYASRDSGDDKDYPDIHSLDNVEEIIGRSESNQRIPANTVTSMLEGDSNSSLSDVHEDLLYKKRKTHVFEEDNTRQSQPISGYKSALPSTKTNKPKDIGEGYESLSNGIQPNDMSRGRCSRKASRNSQSDARDDVLLQTAQSLNLIVNFIKDFEGVNELLERIAVAIEERNRIKKAKLRFLEQNNCKRT